MIAPFYDSGQVARQPGKATAGVAFSGGSTRAMVCALGQLRGLRHVDALRRFSHMASVSGGGWTAIPFCYLPSDVDDDDFLGPVVEPSELQWGGSGPAGPADLTYLPPRSPARVATEVTIPAAIGLAVALKKKHDIPGGWLWGRVMAQMYLQPYGLGAAADNGGPARWYGYTPAWLAEIGKLKGNGALTPGDFDLLRADRPFLMVGISLFLRPDEAESPLVPFEASPLATGVAPPFRGEGLDQGDVGGGGVAGFAYGAASFTPNPTEGTAGFDEPAYRFGLGDILSASSAAFAEACHRAHVLNPQDPNPLDNWIPTYPYASPLRLAAGIGATVSYPLSDGGDLENTGIVSLLRHGAERVLAFINCETPLSRDAKSGQVTVDDQIPPLFGYQPAVPGTPYATYREPLLKPEFAIWAHNQVFPSSAFVPFLQSLWDAQGPAGVQVLQDLPTLANAWHGTVEGRVRVLWVYNSPAPAWEAALSADVRKNQGNDPSLAAFPYYPTTRQIELNARQVNFLAHQTCWRVVEGLSGGKAGAGVLAELLQPVNPREEGSS